MATTREREAAEYLKKHKIAELMDNLVALLLFYRPDKPREFLVAKLIELKEAREGVEKPPTLLNDTNLNAIFRILDPADEKQVTSAQYNQVLKTLGSVRATDSPRDEREDIPYETFMREMRANLQKSSATFYTKQ